MPGIEDQPHRHRRHGCSFRYPTGCFICRHNPAASRGFPRYREAAVLTTRNRCRLKLASVSAFELLTTTFGQCRISVCFRRRMLLRKEVIQPHLPVRLPCYDFVPIASPTFDGSLPQGVRPPASGVADFRDVTGGVYKARERIHRSVADLRLLATPTSRGRVADPDPN
jgi:hypothetical protein